MLNKILSTLEEKVREARFAVVHFVRRIIAGSREPEKANSRVPLLILGCIALVVLFAIVVTTLVTGYRGNRRPYVNAAEAFSAVSIPSDEIFPPEEPDFLPPVLLDRPPRERWTPEDAEPFWTDPLAGGAASWKAEVHSRVDDLLERVP